jgi:putative transposase
VESDSQFNVSRTPHVFQQPAKAEIATKLAHADDLATQGKLQSEIARTLGISVMTLHRWRKLPSGWNGLSRIDQTLQTRIADLQLENLRLRRLVTDLLIEKIKLQEQAVAVVEEFGLDKEKRKGALTVR